MDMYMFALKHIKLLSQIYNVVYLLNMHVSNNLRHKKYVEA